MSPKYIFIYYSIGFSWGFPGGVSGKKKKNPPANAGAPRDSVSIPGSERFPGVGNDTQLQYSCLENSMGRGTWWATVHGGANSMADLLSTS